MIINTTFAIIMAVIFMVILPTILLILFYNKSYFKYIIIPLTICFFIFLFIGVFGKINIGKQVIEISLINNGSWFHTNSFGLFNLDKTNLIINLFMLFPIGAIVLSLTKKHSLLKTILFSFGISFFIELMQFILPINRTVELIDIICNTLSGVIGYFYFFVILKIFKKDIKIN